MNRCTHTKPHSLTASRRAYPLVLALLACASTIAWVSHAHAQQMPSGMGMVRNFPEAALRGALTVTSANEARLNGQTIRMAPGMRLFSPQNTLVMMHTVLGQQFTVNYLIENSTGMLLTAWILSNAEAAQKRAGSDSVQRNFTFESDATPAR